MSAPSRDAPPPAVETQALFTVRSRLDTVVRALAFSSWWGPMVLGVTLRALDLWGTSFVQHTLRPMGFWCLFAAMPLAALALLLEQWRPRARAKIDVAGNALRIHTANGARVVAKRDVLSGLVIPRITGSDMELRLRDGAVLRAVNVDRERAERLLEALDVGARGRRAVVTLGRAHWPISAAIVATVVWIVLTLGMLNLPWSISAAFRLGWVLLGAAASGLMARWVRPREVVIGSDGVLLRGPFRERFVPLSRITGIEVDRGVVLELDDGTAIQETGGSASDRQALAARLREARAAHAEVSAVTDTRLARGERSVRAWRDALAGAVGAEGSYRAATLAPETLEAVLRNPSAPVERRIGAALALAGSGAEGAKEKIRVAAEGCAEERARIAIAEAASEEPDEAVIEAALADSESNRVVRR